MFLRLKLKCEEVSAPVNAASFPPPYVESNERMDNKGRVFRAFADDEVGFSRFVWFLVLLLPNIYQTQILS